MAVKGPKRHPIRRAGTEKSKTGCLTCRTRHIKCDEAQPQCRRCVETGRICPGPVVQKIRFVQEAVGPKKTKRALNIPLLEPRWLLTMPHADKGEMRAFDFFLHRAAPVMSGTLNFALWCHLLPQLSLQDPSVWYSVLAISCLFEHGPTEILPHSSLMQDSYLGPNHRQALSWYNKAMLHFRRSTEHRSPDTSTTLLSCLLFASIEFSQRRCFNGLKLVGNGARLLSRSFSPEEACSLSKPSPILDVVIPMMSRHVMLLATFGQLSAFDSVLWEDNCGAFRKINKPSLSLDDAQAELANLMHHGYEFVRVALLHLQESDVITQLEAQQQLLRSRYVEWRKKLTEMSAINQFGSSEMEYRFSGLLVYYNATYIWLSVCLSLCQTSFDRHIPLFHEIVDHTSQMLHATSGLGIEPYDGEVDVIPPLYFVATKCREPSIRRKALALLEIAPQPKSTPDALWGILPIRCIVEEVIKREETGMQRGENSPRKRAATELPGEIERFYDVEILPRGRENHLTIRMIKHVDALDGSQSIHETVVEIESRGR